MPAYHAPAPSEGGSHESPGDQQYRRRVAPNYAFTLAQAKNPLKLPPLTGAGSNGTYFDSDVDAVWAEYATTLWRPACRCAPG